MRRKTSELKIKARIQLQGNYSMLIGATVLISIIAGVGSSLSVALFGGSSLLSIVMSQIFSIIVSLIASVFSAGLSYMYLNISRGKKTGYGDLFYLFQQHPDRVIMVSIVLTGIEYIFTLPGLIWSYQSTAAAATDIMALLEDTLVMTAIMMVGLIFATLVSMPFTFSYFLLIDHADMGAGEAIKTSMKLMKGNYGRYIYMLLSFAGLLILGVCSLYIGLLWVQPYISMTEVEFYRDLIGELDESEPQTMDRAMNENQNYRYGYPREADDYNAEA